MRNIYFTLILLIFSLGLYGQSSNSYKYLREFNADTTAYIMHNYMEKGESHRGKTVKEFIDEFELDIKSFLLSVDTDNPDNLIGIVFFPYDVNEVGRRNHYKMETNAVRLYFDQSKAAKPLLKKANKWGKNDWNKNIYNEIKNSQIKLTRCLIYYYSPYRNIFKDKLEF